MQIELNVSVSDALEDRIWRKNQKGRSKVLIRNKPLCWWPGVDSGMEADHNFRVWLTKTLTDVVPDDTADDLSPGPNGVCSDWSKFLTIPGFDQTPISHVAATNHKRRSDLGIPTDWRSERHRQVVKAAFRLGVKRWVPGSFRAKNNSQTNGPDFSTDGLFKRTIAEEMLAPAKAGKVLKAFGDQDVRGLFKDHQILNYYGINARRQVDNPSKQRFAVLFKDIFSGVLTPVDKSIYINGNKSSEFARGRARLVQGATWRANCYQQAVASGLMRNLFEYYPFTFKHTTSDQVCAKLDEKYEDLIASGEEPDAFFSDVSDFDGTVPSFFFELFYEVLEEFMDRNFVTSLRLLQRAPYFMPANSVDPLTGEITAKGMWVGHPLLIDTFVFEGGLRSGIAWVSFVGKLFKFAESATVWDDVMGDVAEDMESYMAGKRIISQLNSGDDGIDVGAKRIVRKCQQLREEGKSGYFKIEAERGNGFIGSRYWRAPVARGSSESRWRAMPRIETMIEKRINRENDISHAFNVGWPFGYEQAPLFYGACPSYDEVKTIYNDGYDRFIAPVAGPQSAVLQRARIVADRAIAAAQYGETYIDWEVRNDPDKLHYKYQEHEISAHVLDAISTRIDDKVTESYVRMVYGGEFG